MGDGRVDNETARSSADSSVGCSMELICKARKEALLDTDSRLPGEW